MSCDIGHQVLLKSNEIPQQNMGGGFEQGKSELKFDINVVDKNKRIREHEKREKRVTP